MTEIISRFRSHRSVTAYILLFLTAFLVLLIKSPDALWHPQFWAEDGVIFFVQQQGHNTPQFPLPYAGYLHSTQRLIAWIANYFDIIQQPLFYNFAALCIDAACITYATLIASRYLNIYVVFPSFFALPTAGDIFGTLTNVQWFIQFALVMSLFSTRLPESNKSNYLNILIYATLLLFSLTGPFSTILSILTLGIGLLGIFHKSTTISTQIRPLYVITNICSKLWQSSLLQNSKTQNTRFNYSPILG